MRAFKGLKMSVPDKKKYLMQISLNLNDSILREISGFAVFVYFTARGSVANIWSGWVSLKVSKPNLHSVISCIPMQKAVKKEFRSYADKAFLKLFQGKN